MRARELLKAFTTASEVSVFAVMLPEPLPDRETERLLAQLDQLELSASALFLNRVIFAEDAANCPRCRLALQWQSSVMADLKTCESSKQMFVIRNFVDEIAGAKGLRAITDEIWRLN